MTRNELKMASLGKQGLYVHEQLDSDELKRYLNYLIQTIQTHCSNIRLNTITLDMADNLLEIIYDNYELLDEINRQEEVKK